MDEEHALHVGLVATGGPPLVIALAHGGNIGAGPTLAGFVLAFGVVGLLARLTRERALLPRARWRKRPR